MRYSKYEIRNTKCEMRNAKCEMRNASASRAEEDQTGLLNVKIRESKKIAARKGGGNRELGLILRVKEYHR